MIPDLTPWLAAARLSLSILVALSNKGCQSNRQMTHPYTCPDHSEHSLDSSMKPHDHRDLLLLGACTRSVRTVSSRLGLPWQPFQFQPRGGALPPESPAEGPLCLVQREQGLDWAPSFAWKLVTNQTSLLWILKQAVSSPAEPNRR